MDLVFLHGGPASGKLTTARELSNRLGYPVFHNHLVVDLLSAIFPFGSDPFVRLREQMWMSVFVEAAAARRSIIFTFAPEQTVTEGFPERVRLAVEGAGGRVHFVRLLVSDAEQERRIGNADRGEFHKLNDVQLLLTMRGTGGRGEQPPVDLEIDTDVSTASASAEQIIKHLALQPQVPLPRYPDV
jgi:hypothetical protein